MPRPYHHHSQRFDPELSRGIIGIVLVIAAILFVLSFLGKAGAVGIMLDEYILSFLFGSMRYAAPAIILILAWFYFKDIEYNYRKTHGIGAILFFLSLSSLFHIGFNPTEMWSMALEGSGGGVFGMLAWPMKTYLGSIASVVVLVGMAAVSVFLIFNTALAHFVLLNKKLFAGLGLAGQTVINLFKLFVKTGSGGVKVNGEFEGYESEDDDNVSAQGGPVYGGEGDEDDEVDVNKQRAFVKKAMAGNNNGEEEGAETEEEEALRQAQGKEKNSSPWTKRVIIKNLPPLSLLTTKRDKPTSGDIEANAQAIQSMLSEFGIEVEMGEIRVGPAVTQYSLKPAKGVKLSRITSLSNDLALALAAHPIRIEAPIPGKSLVGIEVPNFKAALVTLKELLESREFAEREHNLMIALGKDVAGKVWFADLPKMPHLLVAGATGSGKTVCINTIIMSLLYQNTAETLRFIMVDPKRVELTLYNGIPHLLAPVITNVQKTVNALKWTTGEMDRRFEILAQAGSRDIHSYNEKHPETKLPHIVFIIDELADLMASAASEVEAGIIRLAQMARAVGIHLIVATQRPSVDIITGLMKANIPARIAFSVASLIDSRTILDCPGAEKLLGRGDMLFLTAELSKPKRIQGAYISEGEVNNVGNYLKGDEEPEYDEAIVGKAVGGTANMFGGPSDDHDAMFDEAKTAVLQAGKASASLLQRRLKVGYARAARILDEMEAAGIIGPADGAKPREILTTEVEVSGTDSGGEFNVFDDGESGEENGDSGDNGDSDEDDENSEEDEEDVGAIEEEVEGAEEDRAEDR
ncbi:MAG: DNA translocase FtsK 4TM domain-containing protein [Candidatus Magasanikbacteria bacterium]|nr:DNA translocase FtsK 4TM domain-containing protein [Candidatus Magasanikbacteria bacterium]